MGIRAAQQLRELFGSLLEATGVLEAWRIEYNESRPHSSLGHQTPGRMDRHTLPVTSTRGHECLFAATAITIQLFVYLFS